MKTVDIPSSADRARWLREAAELAPAPQTRVVPFARAVNFIADTSAFQGWRAEPLGPPSSVFDRELREGDYSDFDLGAHGVGAPVFSLESVTPGLDAPVCLRVLLGELPFEIAAPREPFHSNMLARTWLQEETLYLDTLPAAVVLPRRYAFRYVRIIVAGLSPRHRLRLTGLSARLTAATFDAAPPPPANLTPFQARIDTVAVQTLRNCLHSVFEDGPKRDRRLWLGDLRLQALANSVTFRRFDLVKRCLLLFAGLARPDGLVEACVFENPQPQASGNLMVDYALLFAPTLLDYAEASMDWDTAHDLWPLARHQVATITADFDANGKLPPGEPFGWAFIDWQPALHREGALLGLAIYALRQSAKLANGVGDENGMNQLNARAEALTRIAREQWRAADGSFISGPDAQRSLATTAWMILAGVVTDVEARAVLHQALNDPAHLRPAGPYLWHHVIHACHLVGDHATGQRLLEEYWGKMLDLGADTFWEVFDPDNHFASPYENAQLNSYCHAWSCTPAWFLRTLN